MADAPGTIILPGTWRFTRTADGWRAEPSAEDVIVAATTARVAQPAQFPAPEPEPEPVVDPIEGHRLADRRGLERSLLADAGDPAVSLPTCRPPMVTVIVRTHDEPEEWVREAVESALAQEGVRVEVLLVADGRADAEDLLPKDPRVGLVAIPYHAGIGAARNAALPYARGKFVRFLDADDRLPAGILAAQVKLLGDGAFMAVGPLAIMPGSDPGAVARATLPDGRFGQSVTREQAWDGRPETLREAIASSWQSIVPGTSALYRREACLPVPLDCVRCDDNAANRLALLGQPDSPPPVVWDDRPTLLYRVHMDSLSGPTDDLRFGPVKLAIGVDRQWEGQAIAAHEELARSVDRPLTVGYLDYRLLCGGAQWAVMLMATHLDPRLVKPLFLLDGDSAGAQWLRDHGVECLCRPRASGDYHAWAATQLRERGADAVDVAFAAHLVTQCIRDAVPRAFAHAQSTDLTHAGVLPGQDENIARIDRFIAVSRAVIEANPHLAAKCVEVPSPVDADRCRRAALARHAVRGSLGLAPSDIAVVVSGRLAAKTKRWDLMEAVAERAKAADKRVRFVIAAHIWEGMKQSDEVIQRWHDWIERYRVIWLADLWPWHMPALYAACDLYFSPSDVEGMSLALLEAGAAGCLPVVTDTGGVDEVVADGATGWIVPRGDVDAMTERVLQAARLPAEEAAAMRHFGQLKVAASYDLRRNARAHAMLYHGRLPDGSPDGEQATALASVHA